MTFLLKLLSLIQYTSLTLNCARLLDSPLLSGLKSDQKCVLLGVRLFFATIIPCGIYIHVTFSSSQQVNTVRLAVSQVEIHRYL